VKPPGRILDHGDESYLLVESGYDDASRSVTLLAHPESETFPPEAGVRPVAWRDQGDWFPVARWTAGVVTLQSSRLEAARQLATEILQHYLDERVPLPDVAWVRMIDGAYETTLQDVLPMGLAVPVFDRLELAEETEDGAQVHALQNVPQFLTHLARQGYAGVMWNGSLPVFFCIDEDGDLQFLRIQRGDGTLEMDILEPDGSWLSYDGAEEVAFLDNREACDTRLAEALGDRPLLDWPADGLIWSVGPTPGRPGVVTSDEDGVEYGIVFTHRADAEAWCEEVDEAWEPFPVEELVPLLSHPELDGRGTLLNPGQHRVRSGILWCDGEQTVLDSFGGFWLLRDGELERAV
jgi:hypothetical protein